MYENYELFCLSALAARAIYPYLPANTVTVKAFNKEALYPTILLLSWKEYMEKSQKMSILSTDITTTK